MRVGDRTSEASIHLRLREEAGLHDRPLAGDVLQRDSAGNVRAIGTVRDGEYIVRFPEHATFAYRAGDDEARVGTRAGVPRSVVEDLFLTAALPLLLQTRGHEALHASAVEWDDGVVAFCGQSGAGKTTIACALSQHGRAVWADDAVVFDLDSEREVRTLHLPHAINLRPESLRFLNMTSAGSVRQASGDRERRLTAAIVLAPEGNGTAGLRKLTLEEGFTELIPHAFCFFAERGRARKTTAAYLDLAARIPVFRLSYSRRFDALPESLDTLAKQLSHSASG